jgi:hypothetical protein
MREENARDILCEIGSLGGFLKGRGMAQVNFLKFKNDSGAVLRSEREREDKYRVEDRRLQDGILLWGVGVREVRKSGGQGVLEEAEVLGPDPFGGGPFDVELDPQIAVGFGGRVSGEPHATDGLDIAWLDDRVPLLVWAGQTDPDVPSVQVPEQDPIDAQQRLGQRQRKAKNQVARVRRYHLEAPMGCHTETYHHIAREMPR